MWKKLENGKKNINVYQGWGGFRVRRGRIERISLAIPWSKLYTGAQVGDESPMMFWKKNGCVLFLMICFGEGFLLDSFLNKRVDRFWPNTIQKTRVDRFCPNCEWYWNSFDMICDLYHI